MKLISVQSRGDRLAQIWLTDMGRHIAHLKAVDDMRKCFTTEDTHLIVRRQKAFKAARKWLEGASV